MLSHNLDAVGLKPASRIWGFISKFVMLDRFMKTLLGMDFHPVYVVLRKSCTEDYIGTGAKVSIPFLSFCCISLKQLSDA